jgi:diguanylate cyclase (GGDEF)-like protein
VRIYPHSIGEGIINLGREDTVIGRGNDCDIAVDDPAVSRRHARIRHGADGFEIADLGSVNSVLLNDGIVDRAILRSGDLVRIGHTIFKFLSSDHIEKQYHEEVYTMMISDGLTRIPNKRYFMEVLEREFIRAQRHERPLVLVMFDIDHFKKINDTYGHLAGDLILRDLSERVNAYVRRDETFARYGGEEFSLILPESDTDKARVLCEKIRACVEGKVFNVEHLEIPVSISIGVSQLDPQHHKSADDLIKSADGNLYRAKQNGRNCVVC